MCVGEGEKMNGCMQIKVGGGEEARGCEGGRV